jgi:hypothetical protein
MSKNGERVFPTVSTLNYIPLVLQDAQNIEFRNPLYQPSSA